MLNPFVDLQALPQWKVLVEASRPVAVEIPDCSQMPSLIASTNAKVGRSLLVTVPGSKEAAMDHFL